MAGRRISGWGLAYGVCALFWVPHTAHAKDIPQPATTAGATIAAARKVLEEHYLFPDIAAKLDRELNQAASAGAFQGLTGDALATQVNAEMRKVTRDGHLRLTYQPRLAALLSSQPNVAPQGSGWIEALARQVRETNAGVSKLELLPGNIRYLSYDSFEWGTPAAAEAMATAMQFLRDGDAIIIDLRNNAGGSAEAEAALVSYFVPPGTKLVRFEMRGGADGKPSVSSAAPFSLAGKPTYVLIGPATVSAAEGFAAHAASLHFGTLVGENTGGASYTMRLFPLPGGFTLSVSIGRSINAVTGTDWEGVGIAPSITISDERALAAAEAAAMEKIFLQMGDAERPKSARLLAFYRAQAHPVSAALPLSAYVGRYGDFKVAIDHGQLTVAFSNFSPIVLIPIGPDLFAPVSEPTTQIRFISQGGTVTGWEFDTGGGPQHAARQQFSND